MASTSLGLRGGTQRGAEVTPASIAERLDRLPLTRFHLALVIVVLAGLSLDNMDQVVLSFVIPRYRGEWGLGSTKRTLVLYPAVAGLAMVLLSVLVQRDALSGAALLAAGGAVFAFGTVLLGVFGAYATEVYPTAVRGTGTGWATGMSRFGALAAIPVGGVLLGSGVPLFVNQLVFGIPLLLAALIMAALGLETRQRQLEEIASSPTAP